VHRPEYALLDNINEFWLIGCGGIALKHEVALKDQQKLE
jgi:hypothetical protein